MQETLLWTRQFGTPATDYAFQVATDQFGNVYTSGQTYGSFGGPNAGDEDNFLAKHDAAGNLLWLRQFGTSGTDTGSGSWIDSIGNVYRSMTTNGALAGAHIGDNDMVVVKYDPAGNMLWATQLGTAGDDITWGDITGDAQGNLYVSGRTSGSLGGANAGGQDAVLIKLSPPTSTATVNAAALMVSVDSHAGGPALVTSSAPVSSESGSGALMALAQGSSDKALAATVPQIPSMTLSTEQSLLTSRVVALAREQVFAAFAPDQNDAPLRRALWKADSNTERDDWKLADHAADDPSVADLALTATFASVIN